MKIIIYLTTWIVTSLLPIIVLSDIAYKIIGNYWYIICFFLGAFSIIIARVLYKIYNKQ